MAADQATVVDHLSVTSEIGASVLAVVVCYQGASTIRKTIEALHGQVERVLIVDNGSNPETLEVLASLETWPGVTVNRLGENRGIGYALNVGVRSAREAGYLWLLTMDQDSVVSQGMVAAFARTVMRDPSQVCLTSRREGGTGPIPVAGPVSYAITSGNLVRTSIFEEIGAYDEDFFIDCVDFEFSLRVRRAGYTIHLVPDATMHHQLGEMVQIPDVVRPFYARHAPIRRYYMYRNYGYLAERYVLVFPKFVLKLGLLQLLLLAFIGLYDPRPLRSYGAVLRGVWDYCARRVGPCPHHT